MEDGTEKELELAQLHFERMFRTFAFFAGVTPDVLKESKFVDDIANIYYSSLAVLFEDEKALEPQRVFDWKGDVWEISPPVLSQSSKLKFGEVIDSKQIVQDMIALGAGKWEVMQKICAIFFRKKDEAYHKSFVYEDSDRLLLMRELPMDIALQVGFFLTSSMNFYLNTSTYSKNQELEKQVGSLKNTLSNTVG